MFPPFTSINRSLVLKIPGVVILNTVCSLIAIRYDCTGDSQDHFDHSVKHSTGCGFRKQSFSSVSSSNGESRLDQFSSKYIPLYSACYIVCVLVLPLHVHKGGEELLEICNNSKDDDTVSKGIIFICVWKEI